MDRTKKTLGLCFCSAVFLFGSCITSTNELDLDKKISLDMRIGSGANGLSVPIGSLSKIYLDSLIKIKDDSALDTLEGGLYGFSMDGSIDKVEVNIDDVTIDIPEPDIDDITTSFDDTDVDNIDIKEVEQATTLSISSIDMSTINQSLPSVSFDPVSTTPVVVNVPTQMVGVKITNIPTIKIEEQEKAISFNYTLPSDVESLNSVFFGDENSPLGQKIALQVDLSSIYAVSNNPDITLKSLIVTFPSNFTLVKDPVFDSYVASGSVSVNKNVFTLSNAVVTGVGNDHKLPVSLYISQADFAEYQSVVDEKTVVNYSNKINYELELDVALTCTESGNKSLYVDVDMPSKQLQMNDFSVDTKSKLISLDPSKISSSYKITGLDNISKVNFIDFDDTQSSLDLYISDDFEISPFEFDDNSAITLEFPAGFGFTKNADGKLYVDNNAVGEWKQGNIVDIWPGKAKGKTVKLFVNKLTIEQNVSGEDNSIEVNNDVSYSAVINIAPKKNLTKTALDVLHDQDIMFKVSGGLVVVNSEVEIAEITTEINTTSEVNIDEDVDKALVSINGIDLVKAASLNIGLKFSGVPSSIDQMEIQNMTISFPSFIQLGYDNSDSRISVSGNNLLINGMLKPTELSSTGDGFSISGLTIESMSFAKPIFVNNGNLKINDSIVITGVVSVKDKTIDSKDLDEVKVTPTTSFESLKVKAVSGKVKPDIDPVHEAIAIDLGSDVEFLKNDKNKLNLSDPKITINLTSSVTVPILLDLNLSSKDSKGNFIKQDIAPEKPIRLEPCSINKDSRKTTLVISKNNMVAPEGSDTVYVQMSGLSDLMETIPDSIIFDLTASADQGVDHYVDISRELTVSGDYVVSIPFSFDDVYIEYSDTIKDLGKDLKDIADKISDAKLELEADVESTIPLGVNLTPVALDWKLNPISDITIAPCTVAAGSENGSVSKMKLTVTVKNGSLKNLDAIKITAACQTPDGTQAAASLKKGQYLYLNNIRLKAPDGLDIDLTENDDKK